MRPSAQREIPLIFGHRGVRGPFPENTLAAFERARDEGADGVELDVRLCRTGEVVVAHDVDLARVTHRRDVRLVAELSASELGAIDLGDGAFVPPLGEVLEWARGAAIRVNIEMKRDVPDRTALVRAVAATLARQDAFARQIIVSSFDPWMLLGLHVLSPRAPLGFLFHRGQTHLFPWQWARALPVEVAHAERTLVSPDAVGWAKRQGLRVAAWTVNHPSEISDLAELGVDVLITDRPGMAREALGRLRQAKPVFGLECMGGGTP